MLSLPPGNNTVVERGSLGRDARGRVVTRARPVLRGRMLEREAARSEAAMLAPWRAGIAWARGRRTSGPGRGARTKRRAARVTGRLSRWGMVQSDGAGSVPASGGAVRKTRTRPYDEPATGRLSRWADGAGGRHGRRVGFGPGAGPRSEKFGQDPMNRETDRADGADAGAGPVPGRRARSEKFGQDPMNRETDQADGVDAGSGSVSGRGARSAKLGQDPMNRETDRADGADAGAGPGPGAARAIRKIRTRPYEP
jgi:hypothetical protein